MSFQIRHATPDDAEVLASLIHELAVYEKLEHASKPDVAALRRHLRPEASPRCEALVAETTDTERVVGFALYFPNYSTFLTRWGIYLEDLYVQPAYRGKGVGFALLKRVAAVAVARGCRRLDWSVLDWNDLAITFYKKLGAKPEDEWTTMRLQDEALERLGTLDAKRDA